MPTLNKIRMTNLNYNYGRNVITDQILDMEKTNTLLRMENGGGKSVMVQMLLAPYIAKRYRNFPKRPFAGYFTSSNPTFVLQEWIKDGGAGRFCVGYMARKRPVSIDGAEDMLDFYTWIGEYEGDDETSLENLQLLTDTSNGRKRYLQFREAKEMLEGFENERPGRFALYNMNNSAHARDYFSRLKQFGLGQDEWNQLRDFNQEESGLAKFCSDNDTEEKLIKRVLIPAARRKIDSEGDAKEESHIAHFQKDAASYIDLYESNKNKIEQLEILNEFSKTLESLHEQAETFKAESESLQDVKLSIAAFAAGAELAVASFIEEGQEYGELIESANEEIKNTEHERLSVLWHRFNDERAGRQSELDQEQEEKTQKSERLETLQKEKQCLNCAREGAAVKKYQAQVTEYEEKVKSLELSEGEVRKKQYAYGSALYRIYQNQADQACEKQTQIEADLKADQTGIENTQKSIEKHDKEISDLKAQIAVLNFAVKTFTKKEEKVLKEYGLELIHTMLWNEDLPLYQNLQKTLQDELDLQNGKYQEAADNQENLENKIAQTEKDIQANALKQAEAKNLLTACSDSMEAVNAALARRQQFLARVGASETEIWDSAILENHMQEESVRLRGQEEGALRAIEQARNELENLKTGTSLKIDKPVIEVFEQLGIEIVTGMQWLRKSRMADEKKRRMIEEHPFFAYSLIMEEKDARLLVQTLTEKGLNVSAPLIFASRDMLNHKEASWNGPVSFYLHSNVNLVFPDRLKEMEEACTQRITFQQTHLEEVRSQTSSLDRAWQKVCEDDLSLEKVNGAKEALEKAQQAQKDLVEEKENLERSLDADQKALDAAKKKTETEKEAADALAQRQSKWNAVVDDYPAAKDSFEKRSALQSRTDVLEMKVKTLQSELQNWNQKKDADIERKTHCQNEVKTLKGLVSEFALYKKANPAEGTIDELRPKYDSITKSLSASMLSSYQESLTEAADNLKEARENLVNFEKNYHLCQEDWQPYSYSQQAMLDNEKEQDALQKAIGKLETRITKLTGEVNRLEGKIEGLENQIEDLTGKKEPLEKNQCHAQDLEARKQKLTSQLEDLKKARQALSDKKEAFEKQAITARSHTPMLSAPPEEGLKNLEAEALEKQLTDRIAAMAHQIKKVGTLRTNLENFLTRTMEPLRTRQQMCYDILKSIQPLLDSYNNLPMEIEQKQTLLQNWIDKASADLQYLEKNRQELCTMLLDYVERLHTQIKRIDQDTTVNIHGTHRKMLNLEMKDWEQDLAPAAKVRMDGLLNDLLRQVEEDPSRKEVIISKVIEPASLYDQLCGIHSIGVKLYKIEADRQITITWSKAAAMSGAEGFLCAFVIVAAVLNFQRKDLGSQMYGKKAMHAMIFDNPFAYVQSRHIIEVLMSLCKATNTQLIALSNVTNADVINAFDNIYSLRLISKFDDKNHLSAEHTRHAAEQDARSMEPVQIHVQGSLFDLDDFDEEQEEEY